MNKSQWLGWFIGAASATTVAIMLRLLEIIHYIPWVGLFLGAGISILFIKSLLRDNILVSNKKEENSNDRKNNC